MTISIKFPVEVSICNSLLHGTLNEAYPTIGCIRSHIKEQTDHPLKTSCAHAIHFMRTTKIVDPTKLLEEFTRMNNFVHENQLRFPLEETILEEIVKLKEDDATISTAPTTNTTGVAKVDLPIGSIIKRKPPKEDV